jgi:hypothetical protein
MSEARSGICDVGRRRFPQRISFETSSDNKQNALGDTGELYWAHEIFNPEFISRRDVFFASRLFLRRNMTSDVDGRPQA